MAEQEATQRRITIREIGKLKKEGKKLVVVTAYDVLFAKLGDVDESPGSIHEGPYADVMILT